MKIGMIGLGRMGSGMSERLLNAGHQVVAFDLKEQAVRDIAARGAEGASSIDELIAKLDTPRAVWVMVPFGDPIEKVIANLSEVLSPGDTVVDGGNSHYQDTMRRAATLAERGVSMLDAGTSGGVWGITEGYSLMVGGDEDAFCRLEPVFQALAPAPNQGYGRVGPAGAGHFVKMVHNGIEYGLMEAYAEGFELMRAKEEFGLDLAHVADIWRYGSVVRSWLLDLTADALHEKPGIEIGRAHV